MARSTALWQLHISVFLFGFTAILGKLIVLESVGLVWWRMVLALPVFALVLWWRSGRQWMWIGWRGWSRLVFIGGLLALHWVTFYASIKLAGASVALVCLSSATFFTALLDPWLGGTARKHSLRELLLGLVVLFGIGLIFALERSYLGIIVGVISSILSALTGILNKRVVARYPSPAFNFYEISGGFLVLTALLPLHYWFWPDDGFLPPVASDWLWLCLLAWLCTNLAYDLSIRALRQLSAFEFILAINLEPVYGIVLAIAFLGEGRTLDWGFFAGAAIVFAAVFSQALMPKRDAPEPPAGA